MVIEFCCYNVIFEFFKGWLGFNIVLIEIKLVFKIGFMKLLSYVWFWNIIKCVLIFFIFWVFLCNIIWVNLLSMKWLGKIDLIEFDSWILLIKIWIFIVFDCLINSLVIKRLFFKLVCWF